MKRKIVLIFISIAAIFALATGCGNEATADKTEPNQILLQDTISQEATESTLPTDSTIMIKSEPTTGTSAEEPGTVEDETIDEYIQPSPVKTWQKEENLADTNWQKTDKSGHDVCIDAFLRGFPEIFFDYDEEKMRDINCYVQDSRLVITFIYSMPEYESKWELHAEKTNEPVNISGVEAKLSELMVSGERENNLYYATYAPDMGNETLLLMYAANTGNAYSIYCQNPYIEDGVYKQIDPDIIYGFDKNRPMYPRGLDESMRG